MICNEDGFDPISFGATVGAAMELYRPGMLTKEQIGIERPSAPPRRWSNGRHDGRRARLRQGNRPRLGAPVQAKYGHPELSMSVKGQEFPAYDRAASRAWA
jgi:aldehyde:ferredoxin oxidoreductase